MPRRSKGARLYARERRGREPVLVIRDGAREYSTRCGLGDRGGAEKKLAEWIAAKHRPDLGQRDPARLLIADVLNGYARARAETRSAALIGYHLPPLLGFWATKTILAIKAEACAAYVALRTATRLRSATVNETLMVGRGGARRELETLSAAIGWHHREYQLPIKPVVSLPPKAPARHQWLTRNQVAAMLRDARRQGSRHLMRFILIGIYTGSRAGTIAQLRWLASTDSGSIDIARATLARRGSAEAESMKRRPPARLPARLMAHLRRWHRLDAARGIAQVIHYRGRPIARVRKAFARTCERAGLSAGETPHVLRHTCATWAMQGGADPWELSGYLGMSLKLLLEVYGHHHPDHQASVSDAFTRRRAS